MARAETIRAEKTRSKTYSSDRELRFQHNTSIFVTPNLHLACDMKSVISYRRYQMTRCLGAVDM